MTTPVNTEGNTYRELPFGPAGRLGKDSTFERAEICRGCGKHMYATDKEPIVRRFAARQGIVSYCQPCAASLAPKQ